MLICLFHLKVSQILLFTISISSFFIFSYFKINQIRTNQTSIVLKKTTDHLDDLLDYILYNVFSGVYVLILPFFEVDFASFLLSFFFVLEFS